MSKLIFLDKKPRLFEAVVDVPVPGSDEPQQFTATFKDLPRSALRAEMEAEDADAEVAKKDLIPYRESSADYAADIT